MHVFSVSDNRAERACAQASRDVVATRRRVVELAGAELPEMGLRAGEGPAADAEVLASMLATAEYTVARQLHAAADARAIPLRDPAVQFAARGFSGAWGRRLARAMGVASRFPRTAAHWAAGVITSDHLDPVARLADRFTEAELDALLGELDPFWGQISPPAVERFVRAADRVLHPRPEPGPDELADYARRCLSFSVLGGSVLVAGELPRVEGELVMAAVDAYAERLRSSAEAVPAGARRADALIELVNGAHARGRVPSRAGVPASLTVTLDRTSWGDEVWHTSLGHGLSPSEARFVACDAEVTPVLVERPGDPEPASTVHPLQPCAPGSPTGARVGALARVLLHSPEPLAVGRASRMATKAQRRALAQRDGGCLIPGCGVPAEACQVHHLRDWADGGCSDLDNLVLLCWTHHRQVELDLWRIEPTAVPERVGQSDSTAWQAANGSPWQIVPRPRRRWRL